MSQDSLRRACWTLLAVTWAGIAINLLYAAGSLTRLPAIPFLPVLVITIVSVVGPQAVFAWSMTESQGRRPLPLREGGSDGWSAVLMNTVLICMIPALATVLSPNLLWMTTLPLALMSVLLLHFRNRHLRESTAPSA